MTFKKKVLVTLSVALLAIGGLWFTGVFSIGRSNAPLNYSKATDVLNAYEGRNGAVVYYFEKVRKDQAAADSIRAQAAEARKIADSIRADFALAEPLPFSGTRKQFERFTEIQCNISKTVDDQNFRRSPAWTQVSQRTGIYNTAVQNNFNLYERTFGSNKLLFRDCP